MNVKNIVITGANRGIGLGLAEKYSASGASVFGLARQTTNPASAVKWIEADVTDTASLEQAAEQVTLCDLLVCNAGVYLDRGRDVFATYGDEWADTFAVNVEGVFRTIQAFDTKLGKKSKIAIISSIMATSERAPGGSYIYRASKAAAVNLGRNLAVDLKPRGISVGIYHPGWVQTDMGTSAADISVDTSVTGLMERFDALGLDTTGIFEGYDGTPMAY